MRSPSPSDAGYATAETAVVLPVLVLVAAVVLAVARAAGAQLAAQDAAGVGARTAARGEPAEVVQRVTGQVAPAGSDVTVVRGGGLVRVVVTTTVRPPGAASRLVPALRLRASAVAVDESTAGDQAPAQPGSPP